jgi:hypothetical protein
MNGETHRSGTRRIGIVEPNSSGHRLYYVRLLVQDAARAGNDVVVFLHRESVTTDEYMVQLEDIAHLFSLSPLPADLQRLSLKFLQNIALDSELDLTVVPDGDYVARSMAMSKGWRGRGQLSVLVMREKAQPSSTFGRTAMVNGLKWVLHHWANRQQQANIVLLKTAFWDGKSRLATAQDPVTMSATTMSIAQIRQEFGLDPSRQWFSVLGVVDERKNLPLVTQSLSHLNQQSIGLLVAGRCSPTVLDSAQPLIDSLRSAGTPVIIIDRMLSDLELDSAVGAVNTVIMAHSNDGPSGLFGKAAAAGTRIVAAGSETLRQDLVAFPNLGEWTKLDDLELAAALQRSLTDTTPRSGSSPGTESFTRSLLRLADT